MWCRNFLPYQSICVHPQCLIWVCFTRSFIFCAIFCRSVFFHLTCFFWLLHCLSFNLHLLVIPLTYSNFSCMSFYVNLNAINKNHKPVPSPRSDHDICVLRASILPLSTSLIFDVGTVPAVWYFVSFIIVFPKTCFSMLYMHWNTSLVANCKIWISLPFDILI